MFGASLRRRCNKFPLALGPCALACGMPPRLCVLSLATAMLVLQLDSCSCTVVSGVQLMSGVSQG